MNITFSCLGFSTSHVFCDDVIVGTIDCLFSEPAFHGIGSKLAAKCNAERIIEEYKRQFAQKGVWINNKILAG